MWADKNGWPASLARGTRRKPSTVRGHEMIKGGVPTPHKEVLCLCPAFVPKTDRCANHKETTEAVLKCHEIYKGERGGGGWQPRDTVPTVGTHRHPPLPKDSVLRGPTFGTPRETLPIRIYVGEHRRQTYRRAAARAQTNAMARKNENRRQTYRKSKNLKTQGAPVVAKLSFQKKKEL